MTPKQTHQPATSAEPLTDLNAPDLRAVLISGPLGSGKTTLLNHLLQTQKDGAPGSYVVIENDIGSQNIDQKRLIASPEDTLALTAGCICCNDLHALRGALTQISSQSHISTLFIETTGIANPATVKDLLHEFQIPALTIVTVDVKHFENNELLGRNRETIPYADIIALTWRENDHGRIDRKKINAVTEAVSRVNPHARYVEIDTHGVPVDSDESTLAHPFSVDSATARRHAVSESSLIVSPNKHRMYTLTFPLRRDTTFEEIKDSIAHAAPDGITRAKGSLDNLQFDCTAGDWNTRSTQQQTTGAHITLIHSEPLHSEDFAAIRSNDNLFNVDLGDSQVLSSAITLVERFIHAIPQDVVHNNRLVTETVAGEAWRYVSLPGFPTELKERFLNELLNFYVRGYKALQRDDFKDHPALPYYQREVGYNLSWFLIDCVGELNRWKQLDTISELRPVTLYFRGLESAQDARHIGSFREADLPYLKARLEILEKEQGSQSGVTPEKEGLTLARRAIENCCRLSLDQSWKLAVSVLN